MEYVHHSANAKTVETKSNQNKELKQFSPLDWIFYIIMKGNVNFVHAKKQNAIKNIVPASQVE